MIVDFSSDTTSGVSDEIMHALISANKGCELGYFKDEHTKNVKKWVQSQFSVPVEVAFVSNGTAVNILALRTMTKDICSIICTDTTHISRSEMGATEHALGTKILTVSDEMGKITVEKIKKAISTLGHNPQIKIIVFSQTTELGTCYTPKEIKRICDFAHANKMYVYFDGARVANSLAYLKCSLKELVQDTGVDAFTIGGNKNGCMFGELAVFVNPDLFKDVESYQKQLALTFSKTRFFAAQFEAYFKDDLWLKNAQHANKMAKYLESELEKLGIEIIYPVESNMVFAKIEYPLFKALTKNYILSYSNKAKKIVRLMTNFKTAKKEIDALINDWLDVTNKYKQWDIETIIPKDQNG